MNNFANASTLPTHIGFIVDGNRRWARARNLPTYDGHKTGYEVLKKMAYVAKARGIKYVSAFVFSTDNWQRAKDEVDYLMDLFLWAAAHDLKKLVKDGFKIIFVGRRNGLRAKIREAIAKTEADSAKNTGTTLALCFNYGGQAEICDAAKNLVREMAQKFRESGDLAKLTEEEFTKQLEKNLAKIDENDFAKQLYHPEIPPIDLLVRTSGEQRLSGFMLWRAAYAELLWLDKNWPDMTEEDFDECLAEFAKRSRRFGK